MVLALLAVATAIGFNFYDTASETRPKAFIPRPDDVGDVTHSDAALLQEDSSIKGTREPVVAASAGTDEQFPVVEPEPVEPPVTRIVVSDPLLSKNIKHRQGTIRRHLEVVNNPNASERDVVGALLSISNLSVYTMYDIWGKSRVVPELLVDIEEKMRDPRKYRTKLEWTSNEPGIYRLVSGGAMYEIRQGEFPEFDRVEAAKSAFKGEVPIGELPITDILARAAQVLSHDVQ